MLHYGCLCLTGETRSNILFLMKLCVILDMSLEPGVTIKAGFAARCICYCSAIGLRLMPLSYQAPHADLVVPNDCIIACPCQYFVIRLAASSAEVVG